MPEPTLEERVAALEREVATLKSSGAAPVAGTAGWVERMAGWFKGDPAHAEAAEYGRYFRITGREAPPDWKPGDPIPDPDWWSE